MSKRLLSSDSEDSEHDGAQVCLSITKLKLPSLFVDGLLD